MINLIRIAYILVSCTAHSDCPRSFPFCLVNTNRCASCQECDVCGDGIDGTCGGCGKGYPRLELGSCNGRL